MKDSKEGGIAIVWTMKTNFEPKGVRKTECSSGAPMADC
jgi:hypothetical protein